MKKYNQKQDMKLDIEIALLLGWKWYSTGKSLETGACRYLSPPTIEEAKLHHMIFDKEKAGSEHGHPDNINFPICEDMDLPNWSTDLNLSFQLLSNLKNEKIKSTIEVLPNEQECFKVCIKEKQVINESGRIYYVIDINVKNKDLCIAICKAFIKYNIEKG